MTARDRAGLALVAAMVAAGAGALWVISTASNLPASGDPDRWWSCTADTVDTYPTPPDCLTDTEGSTTP